MTVVMKKGNGYNLHNSSAINVDLHKKMSSKKEEDLM